MDSPARTRLATVLNMLNRISDKGMLTVREKDTIDDAVRALEKLLKVPEPTGAE